MGIKLPELSIPNMSVPEWALILALGVIIGAIAWRAIHHRIRVRFVVTHMSHLLKDGLVKSIHFDGDTRTVSIADNSRATVIPAKPYKGAAVPAKHFEGITDLEIIGAAFRLKKLPWVKFSTWSKKTRGPEFWEVLPLSGFFVNPKVAEPIRKETTPRKDEPSKDTNRAKQASAAALSGSNRDQRPEREHHPERGQGPEQQAPAANN